MLNLFSSEHLELVAATNRHGNQESLDENREHFQGQAKKVFEHLLNGHKVTGSRMYVLHKIQDFRPRIAAIRKFLKDYDMDLESERIPGAHGAKKWWMTKETIESVKSILTKSQLAA